MNSVNKKTISLRLKPLALAVSLLAFSGHALAVGQATKTGGAATVSSNGATTTINQTSSRAVLNWNNFDIGANESVQINQPGVNSAILNRVNSSQLTRIDGTLNSNGRVFVTNPNGIVVGKTGQINASAVTLSSLDITNDNFMDRSYYSSLPVGSKNSGAASTAVINNGKISGADGVTLLGGQVVNTGDISSSAQITLAAGETARLTPSINTPNDAVNIVNLGAGIASNTVVNEGVLSSTGGIGNVTLASAAQGAGSNEVIRNTGKINAAVDSSDSFSQLTNGYANFNASSGSIRIGGDVSAHIISANYGDSLVIDGTLNSIGSDGGITARTDNKLSGTILVDSNARLNGSTVDLAGGTVKVDGQITADQAVLVTGRTATELRDGALNTPFYLLTTGKTSVVGGSHPYDDAGYDAMGYDRNGLDAYGRARLSPYYYY